MSCLHDWAGPAELGTVRLCWDRGWAPRLGWGSGSCPCQRGGCGEGSWGCWRGIWGPHGFPQDLGALGRGGKEAGEGDFLRGLLVPGVGGSRVWCWSPLTASSFPRLRQERCQDGTGDTAEGHRDGSELPGILTRCFSSSVFPTTASAEEKIPCHQLLSSWVSLWHSSTQVKWQGGKLAFLSFLMSFFFIYSGTLIKGINQGMPPLACALLVIFWAVSRAGWRGTRC